MFSISRNFAVSNLPKNSYYKADVVKYAVMQPVTTNLRVKIKLHKKMHIRGGRVIGCRGVRNGFNQPRICPQFPPAPLHKSPSQQHLNVSRFFTLLNQH